MGEGDSRAYVTFVCVEKLNESTGERGMRWLTLEGFPFTGRARQGARPSRVRKCWAVERLEDRCVPAATASGTLSGQAFIDSNGNGSRDPGEFALPGLVVNLMGTTSQGTAVRASATTDAQGSFTFQNVQPGTYTLSYAALPDVLGAANADTTSSGAVIVLSGFSLAGGQTGSQDVGFRGLAPAFVSGRQFLSISTDADFGLPAPGSGVASASTRANNSPILKLTIPDVAGVVNGSNTIDLAGFFSDPDIQDSFVRFDTSAGPINVELFDTQAPRTVANFLNYVTSHRYDSSIFHRQTTLANDGLAVLQGGGFTFTTTGSGTTLPAITADPPVADEVGAANTTGTLAMAKTSAPNSATDEFFFNLADNTNALSPSQQSNGGFTVFGKLASPSDQTVLNNLSALASSATSLSTGRHIRNEGGAFTQIPLTNYSGTNFPTDTTAANFSLVQDVVVTQRTESLTYSVVGNTNPDLVTTTINNNRLTLTYAANQSGTATITVRATDMFGATVDASFNVTVGKGA
jgi:peptidyl-prolyl cis-trans isomerase A (cyclophilin A)